MDSVFYSWQSDLPNSWNRGFIEACLEAAIKELTKSTTLEVNPVPDRDTRGVGGTPNIAATIFEKIDQCRVFVCDVSLIQKWPFVRRCPNPNVLVELGYAVKARGWENIICIHNERTGDISKLPFDIRQHRIMTYSLGRWDDKPAQKRTLTKKLEEALRVALESPDIRRHVLQLELADLETNKELGTSCDVNKISLTIDPTPQPEYLGPESDRFNFIPIKKRTNKEFYRELAEYHSAHHLMKEVRLVLRNSGEKTLNDVQFMADIEQEADIVISDVLPPGPLMEFDLLGVSQRIRVESVIPRRGAVSIIHSADKASILIKFGKIQSCERVFCDSFYIGSAISQNWKLEGQLFCDEYRKPQKSVLEFHFETKQEKRTLRSLIQAYVSSR